MGFRHLDHSLSPPTSRGNIGGHGAPTRSPPRPPRPRKCISQESVQVAPPGGGAGAWPPRVEAWPRVMGRGPVGWRRGLHWVGVASAGRGRVNCIEVARPVHSRAVQSQRSSKALRLHLLPPPMGWTELPRKSPPSALGTASHHVPALQGPRLRPWPRAPATTGQQGVRFGPVPSRPGPAWWQQGRALTWSGQAAAEMNNLGEAGGCPAGRAAGTRVSLLPLFPVRVSLFLSLSLVLFPRFLSLFLLFYFSYVFPLVCLGFVFVAALGFLARSHFPPKTWVAERPRAPGRQG